MSDPLGRCQLRSADFLIPGRLPHAGIWRPAFSLIEALPSSPPRREMPHE
jgi:hypothetical protein